MKKKESVLKILKIISALININKLIIITIPMIVGAAIAFNLHGVFSLSRFFLTVIAVYMLEFGRNLLFAFLNEDEFDLYNYSRVFKNINIKKNKKLYRILAISFLSLGFLINAIIVIFIEFKLIWIGTPLILLAIFYTLPPLKLNCRGLGEITFGTLFGPLILLATFLIQANTLSLPVIIISLPLGFLITNVLWIEKYPSFYFKVKGEDMNFIELLQQNGIIVYISLFVANYAALALIMAIFNHLIWLLPFISLPLVWKAVGSIKKYSNNIPELMRVNGKTIQIYKLTGITMAISAVLDRIINIH